MSYCSVGEGEGFRRRKVRSPGEIRRWCGRPGFLSYQQPAPALQEPHRRPLRRRPFYRLPFRPLLFGLFSVARPRRPPLVLGSQHPSHPTRPGKKLEGPTPLTPPRSYPPRPGVGRSTTRVWTEPVRATPGDPRPGCSGGTDPSRPVTSSGGPGSPPGLRLLFPLPAVFPSGLSPTLVLAATSSAMAVWPLRVVCFVCVASASTLYCMCVTLGGSSTAPLTGVRLKDCHGRRVNVRPQLMRTTREK